MKNHSNPFLTSATLAASIVLALSATAATWQWDGGAGTGDWQTADNWDPIASNTEFNGTFASRLNANGAQALIYTAAEGVTNYGSSSTRGLAIGSGTAGSGTMTITGGTFSTLNATGSNADVIGNSNGNTATLNISGGTFIGAAAGTSLGIGGGPTSYLNVNAGLATITTLALNNTNGTINLNGGTLEVNSIVETAGNNTFNFNGGTYKARADSAGFSGLDRANVRDGGAIINTNGKSITIAQNLLHSNISGDAATDGGLTKTGAGNLTLTGANTYTGLTTVNNGTLFLNTTGGGAVAGDIKLTSTKDSRTILRLQQSHQIAATSVLTMDLANPLSSSANVYTEIALQGNSQTLAGINTTWAAGIGTGSTIFIENRIFGDSGGGDGVLTIDGTADSNWGSRVLVRDGGSGTLSLAKDGNGTLTLGSSNTYTGITTISGGVVKAGHANALGGITNGTTIDTDGTFDFNGFALAGEAFNLAGGKLTNTGTEQISAINGAVTATANSSIGGDTRWDFRASGASLMVNNGVTLTKVDGNVISAVARPITNNGTIQIDGGVFAFHTAGTYGGDGGYTVNSGGELQLGSYGSTSTVTLSNAITSNGGTLSAVDSSGTGGAPVFSGDVSLATSTTTTLRADANGIVPGNISGSGNLTKTGYGIFSLSGDNSYTGVTTVSTGILSLGHANALGASSSVSVTSGATLRIDTASTGSGRTVTINGSGSGYFGALQGTASTSVTWAGNVVLGSNEARIGGGDGGTLTIGGVISDGGNGHAVLFSRAPNSTTILNSVNSYTGDTLFYANTSGVTLKMGIANAIDSGSRVRAGTGSAGGNEYFDLNGYNQNIRALVDDQNANLIVTNNSSTDAVLTLSESNAANSASFNGWIQDGSTNKLSLVKTGAGTQVLSGTNSYTGTTTVSAGTLAINGSISNSTTTVNGTGTLGGIGTTGAVSIANGGTLAPGNSAGSLTVGGDLGLNDASILAFELNPGNTAIGSGINDLVTVTGALTLDGLLRVTATSGDFTGVTSGTWRLFDYGSLSANSILALDSMPTLASGYTWSLDTATAGQVNLTVIPEPNIAALLGGCGVLAFLRRRRA